MRTSAHAAGKYRHWSRGSPADHLVLVLPFRRGWGAGDDLAGLGKAVRAVRKALEALLVPEKLVGAGG